MENEVAKLNTGYTNAIFFIFSQIPKTRQGRNSGGYVGQHLPQGGIYFYIYIREVSL